MLSREEEEEEVEEEGEEDEEYEEEEDNDEIDDDSEVISKLLEADEDTSDEDFSCIVEKTKSKRPRRSTRLADSSYSRTPMIDPMNEYYDSPVALNDDQK